MSGHGTSISLTNGSFTVFAQEVKLNVA